MQILETIGYVVLVGLAFGIIVTISFTIALYFFQRNTYQDQEDIELEEYNYWTKNKTHEKFRKKQR